MVVVFNSIMFVILDEMRLNFIDPKMENYTGTHWIIVTEGEIDYTEVPINYTVFTSTLQSSYVHNPSNNTTINQGRCINISTA